MPETTEFAKYRTQKTPTSLSFSYLSNQLEEFHVSSRKIPDGCYVNVSAGVQRRSGFRITESCPIQNNEKANF